MAGKRKPSPLRYNGGIIRPTPYSTYRAEVNHQKWRPQRTFQSIPECKAWIDDIMLEIETGQRPLGLLEQEQARRAMDLLPAGVTLPEVVNFYLARNAVIKESLTLDEAIERYQDARATVNLRPDSIRTARARLNRLGKAFPSSLVTDIALSDLHELLEEFGVEGQTFNNYRADWSAFFNWCLEHEYVSDNPAKRIRTHSVDDEEPEFFPADHAAMFLHALEEHDPDLLPGYYPGFFLGIRTTEIQRMTGDMLRPDLVRVTPEQAKKRKMRHIEPLPTFLKWLERYPPKPGPLRIPNFRNRSAAVRDRLKAFEWVRNGARHSFGTFFSTLTEDAGRTAYIMGHKDAYLLYSNYRGLTTRAEAEAYFNIHPKG